MNYAAIWKECLEKISGLISDQHFATWFGPVKLAGAEGLRFDLEVPNRFFLEWIKEHYQPLIAEVLKKNTDKDFELSWRISSKESSVNPGLNKGKALRPAKKDFDKHDGDASPEKKPQQARVRRPSGMGFNTRYTFDSFVVGDANKFAHAASSAVAEKLADKYNPLFIYGDVGLGKTHLLQAIGQRAMQNDPSIKTCYYTSERFMNEFINYVSRQKMNDFRKKFRNVDLLLIDDIQFWAGKERTQEEFFHTFNTLYEDHKQIVVTSDKFPKDIAGLEERLRSRFEWGLIADIQPPDMETKIAIIKSKSRGEGIDLPDDVAVLLASLSESNIRELEGYLTRVLAVSSLTGQDLSLDMAKDALKNLIKDKIEKVPSFNEIVKSVAAFYNIKVSDIKSKRRNRAVALPRQVAMYIARECGKLSFPEIGSACDKDHSTVIHAVKKINLEIENNSELKHSISTIKKDIGVC